MTECLIKEVKIMAAGTKLVLGFENSTGNSVSMTYNYAKPSAGLANIKALMAGIIANNVIFANSPVTAVSAKEVTTSENIYDLSE